MLLKCLKSILAQNCKKWGQYRKFKDVLPFHKHTASNACFKLTSLFLRLALNLSQSKRLVLIALSCNESSGESECAYAQTGKIVRCSHILSMDADEDSGQNVQI